MPRLAGLDAPGVLHYVMGNGIEKSEIFLKLFAERRILTGKINDSFGKIKNIVRSLLSFSRKNREGRNSINIYDGLDSTFVLLDNQLRHE